jgi:polyisoprenoid-binding protein YceI
MANCWNEACVFFDARIPMPAREALYTISPSADSTIAIEIFKTGLMRRKKHIFFFERFKGELCYFADHPEASRVNFTIDTNSIVCRDQWLKAKKQQFLAQYARDKILETRTHPEIRFASTRISSKPLRGYAVEGELKIRGTGRIVKVNMVVSPRRNDSFQLDGDATVCLTDFGIRPPSALLGLIGTKNEGLVRLLLWAIPVSGQPAPG